MNYLAHLFLAQPNADSHYGNLLGDFRKGIVIDTLNDGVSKGLENHYTVDRFTDNHASVKQAKALFKPEHRRFAPVAIDMLFDHLLITHWQQFSNIPFHAFCQQSFSLLEGNLHAMPKPMQRSVSHMITHNCFADYAEFEGIGFAIQAVAKRIRFKNDFAQCVQDIEANFETLNSLFLSFFPTLIKHIEQHGPEFGTPTGLIKIKSL
ncbi:ACP phosphodiesterase [Alteromonas sp. 1_MG-2023]|uniref:acyl carrier protein phosphodiesterase n=1 Tax=Alteromonas sp. 1_MG-2023 TaxID=3062669 RepID=UPI0026E26B69|nr:ACP phosphodiesterase [Alteromonas sp. 1_MG-2023]MDO6569235.1 ACP phosphodiesterase [Alteromonas sp. 1_MG-2023]